MLSSRIFVKGLPPSLTEEDFKKHFSSKQEITDAKLIPHRRIGYVGFKSPEEATKAVRYFNKTFIRLSRIGVELAKPIKDESLPVSRKVQREQARDAQRAAKAAKSASPIASSALKRKRSDVDESDPKLKEFLEVMLPKSKSKTLDDVSPFDADIQEPPRKIQAIDLPEAESDDEYAMIPRKSKTDPLKTPQMPTPSVTSAAPVEPSPRPVVATPTASSAAPVISIGNVEDDAAPVNAFAATDDDWLRSRTNRLLDLVESGDLATPPSLGMDAPVSNSVRNEPYPAVELSQHDVVAEATETAASLEDTTTKEQPETDFDQIVESIKATGRLFVRNLPYTATEDDLRKHFQQYGDLQEIHLPLDAAGKSKGFVLVQYDNPNAAAEAYHNLDGEPFQGRLIHILPAEGKREKKLDEFAIEKLPLKKQKLIKKKAEASSTTFNWNALYISQDAVNSSIADRLGVSKAELLDPTSADAGVKQAIAETSIIQETKAYFTSNGVDLNAFKRKERGDTSILVKNFPFGMSLEELRKMFEEFGQVLRVLMPPSGTTAIVEFAQAPQARAAFANLAYRRIKDSVLFLEKAPKDLFTSAPAGDIPSVPVANTSVDVNKPSATDLLDRETDVTNADTATLYIRNLNFDTTTAGLTQLFKPLDGFISARVSTKTDPKKPGQTLSMGFGFVQFRTKAQAQAAAAALDGYNLDNHKIIIKAAHRGLDAAEERRKDDKAKKLAGKRTKIIIKNLPFEATKKDVSTLFGTYGQLRSVRVPKKFDSSARGFAFADFVTAREAENALEALKDTHLLGRRLVLEFAAEDAVDAEEEIERMQKKVGKQVNKVALQKLTGGGRKKFNVEGDDNEDEQ